MISQQIHVDWQVGEEVYAAEAQHLPRQRLGVSPASALIRGEMQVVQHLLRSLLLLVLAMLVGSSQTSSVTQREQLQTRDGIERTLALETLAWQRDYAPLAQRLIDEQVDPLWQREWRGAWSIDSAERGELHVFLTGVQPSDGYTQVDVQIDDSLHHWWISSPYRETRFYQQSENDWVRTLPQDDFWGAPRAVQSGRLHFDYREADASAVEAIAPQMEMIYLKLHRALGVEPATEMITIAIVPDLPQRGALSAEYVEITSPTLSKIPVALSESDYLAHQVASQFTALAFERAVAGHPNLHLSRWQRMTWALRGWLRTHALAQRTPWHQQAEQIFAQRLAVEWPLRLHDLEDWNDPELSTQEERMWQYATSESLLIYIVEIYGREIIPALLDGFGQYPTWREVVPAVFQISSEEFERAYNRYLAERYELSPALFAE